MLEVTRAYNEFMKAQERRVVARVTIDYTDPFIDQSIQVAVSEQAAVSWPAQTADALEAVPYKWASLDGSWVLDGSFRLAPGTEDDASHYQMGWWGQQLAGADGVFALPYPALTVTFVARPITSMKVSGDGARGEYPVDFAVRMFDAGGQLLHEETVVGNTSVIWTKRLDAAITQVTSMTLEVHRWSHTGRQVKVTEFFTSIKQTYEAGAILELNLLEEREVSQGSLPVGNISANEVRIRLSNNDRQFDADNDSSPLFQLLKPNRRVRAWVGFKGDGSGTPVEATLQTQSDWQPSGLIDLSE